jgi:hypothetical protein
MRQGILALLFFSAAGCGIVEPGKTQLNFAGTVTAQATGQPVVGARVALFDIFDTYAITTTDAQGHYSLSQSISTCVEGDFGTAVGASGIGFASKSSAISCSSSALQQINFSLVAGP